MTHSRSVTSAVALTLLLVAAATFAVGPLAIAFVLVVILALVLLVKPVWALGIAIALPILIESDPTWVLGSAAAHFYALIPGTKVAPFEALILLALLAGLLDLGRFVPAMRMLGVMRVPLGLLLVGEVVGAITGHAAGVGFKAVINDSRDSYELFLVPVAIVAIVGRRVSLKRALEFFFVLAAAKGVIGILALAAGASSSTGVSHVTYLDAPANLMCMLGVLFLIAARMKRIALSRAMWISGIFMFASLMLSFRRSFWLGAVLGMIVVVVMTLGPRGRRLIVPAVVVIAALVVLTLSGHTGGSSDIAAPTNSAASTSSLTGRLESLNPTVVSDSADDQYRTGERRNVLRNLEQHPIEGLGWNVDYTQYYPESYETISHDYVHFALLWWWMKGGIAGMLGYVALIVTMVAAGIRVYRRHPDPMVRVAGAAAAAGTLGYALAELTADFTGSDPRSSLLVGAIVGLLAVALRECRTPPSAPAARRTPGEPRVAADAPVAELV